MFEYETQSYVRNSRKIKIDEMKNLCWEKRA